MADRIIIDIAIGNAAFEDAPVSEIEFVLRQVAEIVAVYGLDIPSPKMLRDSNGNTVGAVQAS